MPSEFKNEPFTDFSKPENQQAMEKAIQEVEGLFGKNYPLIINGEKVSSSQTFVSTNPSKTSEVIGTFAKATKDHLADAMNAAQKAFKTWSMKSAQERADLLFKAAAEMRKRKHEFSAWMVLEAGKTWPEADGDTAEAIDFMEFYGREALRYASEQPVTKIPTENNELTYIPLGVGAVIPPWNFPNAIMVGMTTAAIVSGNCVILKPASDTPGIAYLFAEMMHGLGCPPGVLNYLPGSGAEIGDTLVGHPKTRFISFTGSMEVGLHINELAAKHQEGQIWIKRVIAEMGGKDSIVVNSDADLEDAATGIVASAFGYQGQKCSACSRAIIHQDVYDEILPLIQKKTEAIVMGQSKEQGNYMGPVISASAKKTINNYIEIAKKEGQMIVGGQKVSEEGHYIAPHVFKDVDEKATIMQEEIFGPVLAISKAKDIDHAFDIANNTMFGLTGAIYTKSQDVWERAKREYHVGNLYHNRKCTGALVGVHPFGGFNMSGTDSKAGGRDYLMLFTQAKLTSAKK